MLVCSLLCDALGAVSAPALFDDSRASVVLCAASRARATRGLWRPLPARSPARISLHQALCPVAKRHSVLTILAGAPPWLAPWQRKQERQHRPSPRRGELKSEARLISRAQRRAAAMRMQVKLSLLLNTNKAAQSEDLTQSCHDAAWLAPDCLQPARSWRSSLSKANDSRPRLQQ